MLKKPISDIETLIAHCFEMKGFKNNGIVSTCIVEFDDVLENQFTYMYTMVYNNFPILDDGAITDLFMEEAILSDAEMIQRFAILSGYLHAKLNKHYNYQNIDEKGIIRLTRH